LTIEHVEPGTEYVITRYRKHNFNLRTQFERIIAKAGLKSWPKLFQNLRSTRETELAERWPEHVVCAWIGNSKAVAREHYLQVTEEHFERAAGISDDQNDDVKEDVQNAAQQVSEMHYNVPQIKDDPAKFDIKQGTARQYEPSVGRGGFEPP
jgi:hypothetical protein